MDWAASAHPNVGDDEGEVVGGDVVAGPQAQHEAEFLAFVGFGQCWGVSGFA